MAIALVKSATGTSSLATTTASFGSATTTGNLVVLTFTSDNINGTPDAGWTESTGMEQVNNHGHYLWWRISAGETSYQYTINSAVPSAWVLQEFSGTSATPYDISAGQQAASAGTSYTTPAITPTSGNRLVMGAVGASGFSPSFAPYTAWTNSFTAINSVGLTGGGYNDSVGSAYLLVAANGSTAYSTGATFGANATTRTGLIIAFKEAAGGTNYTLTADPGTFTLTGVAANLLATRILTASAGAFNLTGQPANLLKGYSLTAATGAFSLTGQAANLLKGYSLIADTGTFSLTGQAANLIASRILTAAPGSFALTGIDANLVYAPAGSYVLTADMGSFALSGQDANLVYSGVVVSPLGPVGGGKRKASQPNRIRKIIVKSEEDRPNPLKRLPRYNLPGYTPRVVAEKDDQPQVVTDDIRTGMRAENSAVQLVDVIPNSEATMESVAEAINPITQDNYDDEALILLLLAI